MGKDSETVVIVGGAIVGSFTAYFLRKQGFQGQVKVVELDPSYQRSSTALSAAAIRTQFGCDFNTRICLFAADMFRNIKSWFGPQADIGFKEHGYLILRDSADVKQMVEAQNAAGADVSILYPDDLVKRFPWISTEGVTCGTFGNRHEGWFDAWTLMREVQSAAKILGVEYLQGEVASVTTRNGNATGVSLSDGSQLQADWVVVAAGALSARVTRSLDISLPVVPRKRTVFNIQTPQSNSAFPMLFDTSGTWIRPEGEGFICGIAPDPENDPDAYDDFEPDYDLFEEKIWMNLAKRVPAFESLRMTAAWAGHYEINTFDHNGIVGPHDEIKNLMFATGFSGHGVMQAPAAGRGIAELICTGDYQTLDLTPLGYDRITKNIPVRENSVY